MNGLAAQDRLRELFSRTEQGGDEELFRQAREARTACWGDRIFLYGFLYLSTFCRNDCAFCQYRRSNAEEQRYRKSLRELREAGLRLAEDGVHLLDLPGKVALLGAELLIRALSQKLLQFAGHGCLQLGQVDADVLGAGGHVEPFIYAQH